MKRNILILTTISSFLFACSNKDSQQVATNEIDSVSYCIGISYSSFLKEAGLQNLDFNQFEEGITAITNKKELSINKDSCHQIIGRFLDQLKEKPANKDAEENDMEQICYCLGVDIAENIKSKFLIEFKPEFLIDGFEDIYNGDSTWISLEDAGLFIDKIYTKNQQEVLKKQQEEMSKQIEKDKKALQNTKEGKVILESGLQIERITDGTGDYPNINSQVTVHYTGKLEDGTIFDSSVERNEPAIFPVGGVIPGWTEALQLMQVGSKWIVTIPGNLAYGESGIPQAGIPANATLIFEVELLAIN